MSEIKDTEIDLKLETDEESTPEYSEIETEAMAHGWNPEGVEGKRNLSAEEFMDRQPLYDDIRSLKKSYRKLQEGIEAMKEMHEGIRKREREKTINELKAQKKAALEDENYDAVIEIDDAIAQERASADVKTTNTEFEAWIEDNEWYSQDPEMKEWADIYGTGYANSHPNKPVREVYDMVAKEVKKHFPDKFGKPTRPEVSPVEGASRGRGGKRAANRHSVSELSSQEQQIMRTILRTVPGMTEDKYLEEYFG